MVAIKGLPQRGLQYNIDKYIMEIIYQLMRTFLLLLLILFANTSKLASAEKAPSLRPVMKNITAEGSCAVIGMSAEQSQLIALQRARAAAIEKVSGIVVSSSTLVVDFRLAADFIKTYSKGYIVSEKREWLPLGQYQKDSSTAPIPEYRVRIIADVYTPKSTIRPIGLQAKADRTLYRNGETAQINIRVGRKARVAIFNIMANDEVLMIFPNDQERQNLLTSNEAFLFPGQDSPSELIMQTLQGHDKDSEAFFIVALDTKSSKDFPELFQIGKPMRLEEFFRRYMEISDYAEDTIVTYEIVESNTI